MIRYFTALAIAYTALTGTASAKESFFYCRDNAMALEMLQSLASLYDTSVEKRRLLSQHDIRTWWNAYKAKCSTVVLDSPSVKVIKKSSETRYRRYTNAIGTPATAEANSSCINIFEQTVVQSIAEISDPNLGRVFLLVVDSKSAPRLTSNPAGLGLKKPLGGCRK